MGPREKHSNEFPGTLGGTLNGDPCSLLGVIGVLPGYIRGIQGLYEGYIRYWDYGSLLGVPPNNP